MQKKKKKEKKRKKEKKEKNRKKRKRAQRKSGSWRATPLVAAPQQGPRAAAASQSHERGTARQASLRWPTPCQPPKGPAKGGEGGPLTPGWQCCRGGSYGQKQRAEREADEAESRERGRRGREKSRISVSKRGLGESKRTPTTQV